MSVSTKPVWSVGDQVLHPARPEWGVGCVISSERDFGQGTPCQRLKIRFDKVGSKTLSTAFVDLRAASGDGGAGSGGVNGADGVGSDAELAEILVRLPEPATDPFRPMHDRLASILECFGHDSEGGGLLEWAIGRSGLRDPLARFNRHELEDFFDRYRVNAERALVELARGMSREQHAGVAATVAQAPEVGQRAWKRVTARR